MRLENVIRETGSVINKTGSRLTWHLDGDDADLLHQVINDVLEPQEVRRRVVVPVLDMGR